jgi:hypothetical protein
LIGGFLPRSSALPPDLGVMLNAVPGASRDQALGKSFMPHFGQRSGVSLVNLPDTEVLRDLRSHCSSQKDTHARTLGMLL